MSAGRIMASAVVAGSGAVLIGVVGTVLVTATQPFAGLLMAGFGVVLGVVLIGAAAWLYRSALSARQALRVAAWNILGIIAIGAAVVILYAYQAAMGSPVSAPFFSGAVLVGVSAVAHVLIGINDVRRIRAEDLAQERLKFAVVSRVLRHDLRTYSQILMGYADRMATASPADAADDPLADRVREIAAELAAIHEDVKTIQKVLDAPDARQQLDLPTIVHDAVSEVQTEYGDATIDVDLPSSRPITHHPQFPAAIHELIKNALEHNDATPSDREVRISLRDETPPSELVIADNGPGIPEKQRALIRGETEITQLQHGNGLGLWLVKWICDAAGDSVHFDTTDAGTTVSLRLTTT